MLVDPSVRRSALALALLVACFATGCGKQQDSGAAAAGLVVPKQAQADKLNAYVEAYNKLLQWHQFNQILADYRDSNPDIAKTGVKLTNYRFYGSDLEAPIKAFDQAIASAGQLPELDAQAQSLRDLLVKLNPTYQQALAYASSKEYLSDGGAKAREIDGPLVAGLEAADEATDAFQAALSAQTLKRDQARLAELKPGSVEFQKMKASLAVRALGENLWAAVDDKAALSAYRQSLDALATANTELGTLKPGPKAQPAWDPVCKRYKERVDSLIGIARELSVGLESGDEGAVHDKLEAFTKARNDSIDAHNDCG